MTDLPPPILILACIGAALVLGMRIGYAIARKHNKHEALKHNVLSEEYTLLYEDMCYADKLLHDIYDALMKQDSNGIVQFVKNFQEWNGNDDVPKE